MDLMLIVFLPLRVFAFNPVLCGMLAGVFTIPVFLPIYATGSRLALALAALVWWAFCWREATVAPDLDARPDLVRLGPFFLAAAILGAWHLIRGHRRPAPPEGGSRRPRRRGR